MKDMKLEKSDWVILGIVLFTTLYVAAQVVRALVR